MCGTRYRSSFMLDMDNAPAWTGLRGIEKIDAAASSTGAAQEQLADVMAEIARWKLNPPTDTEVERLRVEVDGTHDKIAKVAQSLEQAKTEILALVPGAPELAYLKVAKAEAAEIRRLVTQHIEDAHRRKTVAVAEDANRWAKLAITVSVVGLLLSVVVLMRPG